MDLIGTSFLIASAKPRELSQFYALVCNGKVIKGFNSNHYLIMYSENYKIQIYKPSTEIFKSVEEPLVFSICFQKEPSLDPSFKLKEWCDELIALGSQTYKKPRAESFGAEAWMSDPEGNYFLLFVPLLRVDEKNINKI